MPKAHHTARGFRNNYAGTVVKSFGDFLRWQTERVIKRLPPDPTLKTPEQPADLDFIDANARAATMIPAVTWIGHATALVQASGLNVLTDPVFSLRASPVQFLGPARAQPPGVPLERLPHIDVVLISHDHYDHLDRACLPLVHENAARGLERSGADSLGLGRETQQHWGTFSLADEPLDQPLHELAAARSLKRVSEEAFFLLPVGGTRQLPRRES